MNLLEEYARSIVLERENRRIEEPIAGTSPGWTETMTEVADLPSLDCALGLSEGGVFFSFFSFFSFFFKIMYSLLRYTKPRGALAMA